MAEPKDAHSFSSGGLKGKGGTFVSYSGPVYLLWRWHTDAPLHFATIAMDMGRKLGNVDIEL